MSARAEHPKDFLSLDDWPRAALEKILVKDAFKKTQALGDALAEGHNKILKKHGLPYCAVIAVRNDEAGHRDVNHGFADQLTPLPLPHFYLEAREIEMPVPFWNFPLPHD